MSEGDRRLIVGPFNRVEGDLEIRLDIREGHVAEARVNSPLVTRMAPVAPSLTITPINSCTALCGTCLAFQCLHWTRM